MWRPMSFESVRQYGADREPEGESLPLIASPAVSRYPFCGGRPPQRPRLEEEAGQKPVTG